ncbi:immature colon carcinoma transcript, putative [Ixodes scapularis]|uniref:Large ribosomal subunit protein mL62 n=1 Tax=Ixodes scapularis TaxID=6945 RepID=B7QP24_IXOSC|nr:immature colon carcinoma transcript, putative [Ixodes scapularis]|eukprot:XP_002416679.1 immature colon carcinoma transcript, putative [Ixodes scapularis]
MGICRLPVCFDFSRRILFLNPSLSVLNSGLKFSKWSRDDEASEKQSGKADDENVFTGNVPLDQLQVSYCRSSGPGGQNVNKVNSKVEIRFHVQSAQWIPPLGRKKLLETCQHMMNKNGQLIVTSEKTRYQQLNTTDCLERLKALIIKACEPPPELSPETKLMISSR